MRRGSSWTAGSIGRPVQHPDQYRQLRVSTCAAGGNTGVRLAATGASSRSGHWTCTYLEFIPFESAYAGFADRTFWAPAPMAQVNGSVIATEPAADRSWE